MVPGGVRSWPAAGAASVLLLLAGAQGAALAKDEGGEPFGIRVGDTLRVIPRGQYRPRLLLHGGKDFAPGDTYDAVSHRARLGLEVRLGTWGGALFELQDVRRWGEETGTLGDFAADGLDMHQAWAEVRLRVCIGELWARGGRQEISLDNQRLVGAVGWSDQGRSFDGVVLGLRREGWGEARLLYAKTGEEDALVRRTDAAGDSAVVRGAVADRDLAGAWVRMTRLPWFRPSLVALYDRDAAADRHRATFGLYLDSAPHNGVTYSGELYLQLGRRGAGAAARDIRAFLGAASLGYRAPLPWEPSVGVWYEHLSGDGSTGDGTDRAFDTLFATNHKFYGFMDLFLDVPLHTGGLGLVDVGGRAGVRPCDCLRAWVDWHHFELARRNSSGASALGDEIDVVVDVRPWRYLALQAVLGAFLPGDGISPLRGGGDDTELYGYLQTDLRF